MHATTLVQELPLTAAGADVAAAARNDATARLGGLFDAHHRRLYRLGLRLLCDAEEARDLVQETFLRAASAAARVPDEEPAAEAWLVRVAINLCRDRHRRRAVRRAHAAPMPREVAAGDGEAARLARWSVRTALLALSPRRRAVVVLHEIEGRTAAEIAALLGTRAVTVRWHLSRARRELAKVLMAADAGGKEMR
ncbi:MAG TPA: RNA polymerase sigma factor [Thermoanaerobaculia bacterium]|nr:RNA polymerase sigma factor [Thermoanaerobaculia bacterium]